VGPTRRPVALAFVRAPVLGRVKQRLAADVGAREALRIYRRLAEDVHATLCAAAAAGVCDVVLCAAEDDPGEGTRAVAAWLPGAREVWAQGPGDLGARMERMTTRALAAGAPRVALVGTDVVGLTVPAIAAAFEALATADVALAPTPDGGYALLACARAEPALFRDMPWSTPRVAALTRERAAAAGLSVALLEGLRDVDTAADLAGSFPTLSVLMPVLDEMPALEVRLERLLAQARPLGDAVEVLVVDGGSRDGSAHVAARLGARVLHASAGRGTQLRAAARQARGRWLWTLHADADVAPGTLARVLDHARRGTHPWAFLSTRIGLPGPFYRLLETLTEIRARWLGLPYGDQAVLVERGLFDAAGGYPDVPLMEDVLLAQRLRRRHRPALIRGPAIAVDGRRWARLGAVRTSVQNLRALLSFLCGRAEPAALARTYQRGVG
jgi:rSAM/selenodomain-associated transferase 2/rSAM/selenodomain-associated transferase 1